MRTEWKATRSGEATRRPTRKQRVVPVRGESTMKPCRMHLEDN